MWLFPEVSEVFWRTRTKNDMILSFGTVLKAVCMVSCYEFAGFSDFVTVFMKPVLHDEEELEKIKICFRYLLLEKMRFPGSFVIQLQIVIEIRRVEVG